MIIVIVTIAATIDQVPMDKHRGEIHIAARMVPKTAAEKDFFEKLLIEFDSDNDDTLNRSEVWRLGRIVLI